MRRLGWFKGTVAAVAWEAYREDMTVTVEIPDDVFPMMFEEGVDPARKILEDAVAQAYRDGRIGTRVLREVLGLSWHEKEAFLLQKKIYHDITAEQVLADAKMLGELRERQLAKNPIP